MNSIIHAATLLPLLWGLACTATQAQIYQWVDEQGRTHFDDNRPGSDREKVEEVKVRKPNLMNRFVAPPPPVEKPAPKPVVNKTPPVSVLPSEEPVGLAARQAACAKMKQAYEASQACYLACSKPVPNGRSNAECGHCTNIVDPGC